MSLSLQELHAIEEEIREVRLQIARLAYRKKRAGANKTKARLQTRIDAIEQKIKDFERRLIRSWQHD